MHKAVIGVIESVSPTGDSFKGDWKVSDVAWDKTVVSNPGSGDKTNVFEYLERKVSDSLYFLYISDRFGLWTPPQTLPFSYVRPSPPVTNGLVWWTEQAQVTGDVQTDMSGTVFAQSHRQRRAFWCCTVVSFWVRLADRVKISTHQSAVIWPKSLTVTFRLIGFENLLNHTPILLSHTPPIN